MSTHPAEAGRRPGANGEQQTGEPKLTDTELGVRAASLMDLAIHRVISTPPFSQLLIDAFVSGELYELAEKEYQHFASNENPHDIGYKIFPDADETDPQRKRQELTIRRYIGWNNGSFRDTKLGQVQVFRSGDGILERGRILFFDNGVEHVDTVFAAQKLEDLIDRY